MACNSCAKPYSLLRKEKGCPSCGFSYCSNCLCHKLFLKKLNAEAKVCAKCKSLGGSTEPKKIEPPDVYYKRIAANKSDSVDRPDTKTENQETDQAIEARLKKLKEDRKAATPGSSQVEIEQRLKNIKGEIPKTTDAELQERLAKLRGVSVSMFENKPIIPVPDLRTEVEQADDLMKQYMTQNQIDTKYKDGFDSLINNMEGRLNILKSDNPNAAGSSKPEVEESEDEEETVNKIVEKIKSTAALKEDDDDITPSTNDELPFCEICNEDATMRCLGCKYLFCKLCFKDHKDDDDGCNRYEPYKPPKGSLY